MKKMITAAVAVLMCAASAMADLSGTQMNVSVTHNQFAGLSDVAGTHQYGSPNALINPMWGTVLVTSPAAPAGNALNIDFTNFAYSAFVAPFPATGTVQITNIAEAVNISSVKVLVNGNNIALSVTNLGNGFAATWSAPTVFNANPMQPNITVAWNSIPTPGAMALLGLAGVVGYRRKRQK